MHVFLQVEKVFRQHIFHRLQPLFGVLLENFYEDTLGQVVTDGLHLCGSPLFIPTEDIKHAVGGGQIVVAVAPEELAPRYHVVKHASKGPYVVGLVGHDELVGELRAATFRRPRCCKGRLTCAHHLLVYCGQCLLDIIFGRPR